MGVCGGVWACGRGRHGQLGLGNFRDAGPLTFCESLRGMRVIAAAAGQAHSLAVTESGDVRTHAREREPQSLRLRSLSAAYFRFS